MHKGWTRRYLTIRSRQILPIQQMKNPWGKLGLLHRITKRERQPPLESETPVGDHIHQPVAQEGADRCRILEPRTKLEAFVNGDELGDRHVRRNGASAMGFVRKARRAMQGMFQTLDRFPRRNTIRDTRVPRGGIQSVIVQLERPDIG